MKETTANIWTTTELVSTNSTDYSGAPIIADDSQGMIHIVWTDKTDVPDLISDFNIFYKIHKTSVQESAHSVLCSWFILPVVSAIIAVEVIDRKKNDLTKTKSL